MDAPSRYDIRDASFEDFVAFLFAHDVVPSPGNPWYWRAEVDYEPRRIASYYVRLFSAPRLLLSRFSVGELQQGFWAIQNGILECSARNIIWDRTVPFEIRADCVRSMADLYAQLFVEEPLETASNMWWDSLAYDWHCGNRARANGGEDQLMQDVMFATLGKILNVPSESCQTAALHGLGHLHHPDTNELVQSYLARNPSITPDLREYALAAAQFRVL